ncbi:MAG: acetyl-CoA carboxylase, carboxyltransferase subunit beta [Rickettsiales bacterium]|jgi:acetyl-CoA carboxylase carboxyl transferase subunit beta|nr:acetyl-CoA carboxylase, carboxyltransferase subunit beta [Rickettsiales bacterium]
MNWIREVLRPKIKTLFSKIKDVPENLWVPCPKCSTLMYKKDMERHLNVCPKCDFHMALPRDERLAMLFDNRKFSRVEVRHPIDDPLGFKDLKKYSQRLEQYREDTQQHDAATVAHGKIGGIESVVFILDFDFMGGSMGTYVGEAMLAAAKTAVKKKAPLIAVTASGGARMQEGILSLMQMARTTMAVNMLRDARLPYIVILTNPTMGGVSASFAMLGDIEIAERGAVIGFAGRRVIEQSIRHKLPPEFQTAEYLETQGDVDLVVHRRALKDTLANILKLLMNKGRK